MPVAEIPRIDLNLESFSLSISVILAGIAVVVWRGEGEGGVDKM